MDGIGRRSFLGALAALAGGAAAGACTAPGDGSYGGGGSSGALSWWDQFQPIAPFEKKYFAKYSAANGVQIKYTVQNPATFTRELQLAFQSKQLPDVFTASGIAVPTSSLRDAGWFTPLNLDQNHRDMLPEGTLIEGLNMFDGQPYSFPIFTFRSHDAVVWFNRDLLDRAGVDVDSPPTTYDGIRAAARAVQKGGDASGWIAPLKLTDRMSSQVSQLATAAGFPGGLDGSSFRTGEYDFAADQFVDALDFFVAMRKDGALFPASTSLDARTARARWATGVAGFFFDGSYNVGVLKGSFAAFLPKVGVGTSIPVPAEDTVPTISGVAANPGVSLWISKTSRKAAVASRLISAFATDDVQTGIAEAMDQPPLNTSVLDDADVADVYRRAVSQMAKEVFRGPVAVVRNPQTATVAGLVRPAEPNLGQIVAGAVSGDIADWKKALQKLSDDSNAERDRAVKAATAKGATASRDDWVFADWKPGTDYVTRPA